MPGQEGKPVLIVLLRGWGRMGILPESFHQLVARLAPQAEIREARLDMGHLSAADPRQIVDSAFDQIDGWVQALAPERIILVGYSAGSLIARGVVLRAHGGVLNGPAEMFGTPCAWADRIERVVYLAGILRGWTISSATPKLQRFLHPLMLGFAGLYRLLRGRPAFIMHCERGAPFVIDLRLRYLALQRSGRGLPLYVFLLGTHDEFISPADALDVQVGKDMVFLEIPGSNHSNIADLMCEDGVAATRRDRLEAAIFGAPEALSALGVHHEDIDDYLEPMDRRMAEPYDTSIEEAVIILHGIRDEGFWTKRIARAIKEEGGRTTIRAPSPSYGYFSMWNFVLPLARKDKAKWLMEQYCDVRICFPNARISFVGHSNGTYLAAKALQMCDAIRFHRIFFAGSVVRRDFPWQNFAGRVGTLVNATAGDDLVVASLPGFMEAAGLRFLDVGGAGHRGFRQTDGFIHAVGPLRGGHGAGVSEPMWPAIARYITRGDVPDIPADLVGLHPDGLRPRLVVGAIRAALILLPLSLAGLVWLVAQYGGPTAGLVLAALLVWLIWKIVRFF